MNILGSKIFIFGGQVEGYFFNDLLTFDLNMLQVPHNKWEILIPNTPTDGSSSIQAPPARTNHTMIQWNNKLFLFGGTDGIHWYNDVWAYDHGTNTWSPQECIGFIPTAREGHAAALCGDVMYVFGGRTEEGKDLGDLAAFRIPTRRWYTFQNMGPSPSPRSGHGLTAVGDKILVVGGEPSSAPRDPSELSLTYVLDTSKIRYPPDNQSQPNGQKTGPRRPSVGDRSGTPSQERSTSSQGQYPNGVSKWQVRNTSQDSVGDQQQATRATDNISPIGTQGPGAAAFANRANQARGSTAPGPPSGPPPGGPPPSVPSQQPINAQSPQQTAPRAQPNGVPRPFGGSEGRDSPRFGQRTESPLPNGIGPLPREAPQQTRASPPGAFPSSPTRQPTETPNAQIPGANNIQKTAAHHSNTIPEASLRGPQSKGSFDSTSQNTMTTTDENFKTPMEDPTRSLSAMGHQPAADSGLGSSPALSQQHESLLKELEAAKTKNAWYAAELAMAREAGFSAGASGSPISKREPPESLDEGDKHLMEAFVKMRSDLATVQEAFAKAQAAQGEQVAQVERQRDAAIREAVFHKQRGTGASGRDRNNSVSSSGAGAEREEDSARRLAIALASQAEAQSRTHLLSAALEREQETRHYCEEGEKYAKQRVAELEKYKQETSQDLEQLRSELHEAQRLAREETANAAEHRSASRTLQVDKNELSGKLAAITEQYKDHDNILGSLREAVNASMEKAAVLEKKLDYERRERASTEEKLAQLKSEHESRTSELDATSRRLQDAEDLAASHAAEAKTHREAVLAGLGRISDRELDGSAMQDERVEALQNAVDIARETARQNQEAADHASERVLTAERRIAGLEAFQEQTAREGLELRRQLQQNSRENTSLQTAKTDLQQKLSNHKMEFTSLQVQHSTLRELLAERGIDPNSSPARNRGAAADVTRLKELETQLEVQSKAVEEMRQAFDQRQEEANRGWEEKLANLDNDYQSAVKYLKGTEKMLSKMKQELHRYKTANKDLEEQLSRAKSSPPDSNSATPTPPPLWETERNQLRSDVDELNSRVRQDHYTLEQQAAEIRAAHAEREVAQQSLAQAQKQSESQLTTLKEHNELLEKRADEAERKVQTLLEKVNNSVENFRHSRQMNGLHPEEASAYSKGHSRGFSASSLGAESNYSNAGEPAPNLNDRNSMALDSLASELETLRSHWETTNKNYRSSQQSVNITTPVTPGGQMTSEGESLANWRRKLDLREREESAGRESASPHR